MVFRAKIIAMLVSVVLIHSVVPGFAETGDFPMRETPRPQTTNRVPHVQMGVRAIPEFSEAILQHVALLPGISLGSTRVSLPGAVGFHINDGVVITQPEAIVGGREFAHLHPDGSLHASLHPEIAQQAVKAGWATPHPWANQREGWQGFVMIYTPTTQDALEVVIRLIDLSYRFVVGSAANNPHS